MVFYHSKARAWLLTQEAQKNKGPFHLRTKYFRSKRKHNIDLRGASHFPELKATDRPFDLNSRVNRSRSGASRTSPSTWRFRPKSAKTGPTQTTPMASSAPENKVLLTSGPNPMNCLQACTCTISLYLQACEYKSSLKLLVVTNVVDSSMLMAGYQLKYLVF